MPIHNVFIISSGRNVIFSRQFLEKNEANFLEFQQQLHEQSRLIVSANKSALSIDDNIRVVFARLGDFSLFVCGTEECDETILSEVFDSMSKVLREVLTTSMTESSLLHPDSYAKWLVALDEIVCQGQIENTDVDLVMKESKLKNL